jgi:hypothetical protein
MERPDRPTLSLAGAGGTLIGMTAAVMVVGLLVGWLAGAPGWGILVGAIVGIPVGIASVYKRYQGVFK